MINLPAKAKILVVDDNIQLLKLLELFINREGYMAFAASNREQALALADQQEFDLLITDLIMPVKEGVETILGFQKLHPLTRIIAMSGGGLCASAWNYLKIARSLGVLRTLEKPFSKDELLESVSRELAAGREAYGNICTSIVPGMVRKV